MVVAHSSAHVVDQSSKLVQPALELVTTNSDKTKAEVIWALKCIESGYSNNSNNDMNAVFKCLFPDSEIASSFQMEPDKLHYYVTFALASYFKLLLIDTLKKSDCHVLSFDESLNDFTQTSEMDLLVRFFDNSTNTVNTRFYGVEMKRNENEQQLINVGSCGLHTRHGAFKTCV